MCAMCGVPLPPPAGERTAGHVPIPIAPDAGWSSPDAGDPLDRTGPPCLVVAHGSLAGSRFVLRTESVTIGRDPGSDVFLDDVTVSRQQARIRRRGHSFTVVDTDSFNGTYLNGVRVDHEAVLAHGDQLQAGKFRLFFLEP